MSAWGTRRQLSFIMTFILLLVLGMVVLVALNKDVPTCTDGLQNQDELGTDCGGKCLAICPVETSEVIVLWARTFKVREGQYDVAAYVENPNQFGVLSAKYSIRIYDSENVPVKDLVGTTYLNPNERALILAPNVDVGFRTPSRAFIEFEKPIKWERLDQLRKPKLIVANQKIESQPIVTVRATVTNTSTFGVSNIIAYSILYDSSGTVLGASRTYLDSLEAEQAKEVVFTWPEPIIPTPVSADVFTSIDLVTDHILKPAAASVVR